ncbi:MAG: resolvase [Nitrosopumilus sp.]|nr:resolvase [Nitrosopumilus sp.]MDA7942123.1 resolvase [Nitrosopumilus sp.]MDA7943628.1 resolvase [Nitrosopumilus sp.]MDA7944343.1 resolvase [Nitrosopumilus sp.]MDA7954095.1 resolvase [Nitrosopumilus sp.]
MARNGGRRGARLRRQRGYRWEETLADRFNGTGKWRAFRLGSPSTGLPDILAVCPSEGLIYAIEAKSGSGMSLYVPADQIRRCKEWVDTFSGMAGGQVLLAFKFLSKKRTGPGRYVQRELREYYKVWDGDAADCVCTYDGDVFERTGGSRRPIRLAECPMPFRTRRRT